MISIITRAGNDAEPAIFDLYLCMRNQVDFDFEWIILIRPDYEFNSSGLKQRLESDPKLMSRTKVIRTMTDSRGELLNLGLSHSNGTHFVVVDDDDLITADFSLQFNLAALDSPKGIIRTIPSRKIVKEPKQLSGNLISMSKCEFVWPLDFDIYSHLYSNQTPCLSIAFPTSVAKDNQLEWDPSLKAVEDWDFLVSFLRKATVKQIPVSTSIYRQQKKSTRSKRSLRIAEWKISERTVRLRIPQYFREIEKRHVSFELKDYKPQKETENGPVVLFIANKLHSFPWLFSVSRGIYSLFRR